MNLPLSLVQDLTEYIAQSKLSDEKKSRYVEILRSDDLTTVDEQEMDAFIVDLRGVAAAYEDAILDSGDPDAIEQLVENKKVLYEWMNAGTEASLKALQEDAAKVNVAAYERAVAKQESGQTPTQEISASQTSEESSEPEEDTLGEVSHPDMSDKAVRRPGMSGSIIDDLVGGSSY